MMRLSKLDQKLKKPGGVVDVSCYGQQAIETPRLTPHNTQDTTPPETKFRDDFLQNHGEYTTEMAAFICSLSLLSIK